MEPLLKAVVAKVSLYGLACFRPRIKDAPPNFDEWQPAAILPFADCPFGDAEGFGNLLLGQQTGVERFACGLVSRV